MVTVQKQSLLNRYRLYKLGRILAKINRLEEHYKRMPDDTLQAETAHFRERLAQGESLEAILPEAFATVREASRRVLGMFPFDVQVIGAIVLHQGKIAEMKTGEGKTLTATMPLYLNALTQKGAILVTVNDYLAKRDALEMKPLYDYLGVSVGIGVFDESEEPDTDMKKAVYHSDIIYSTSTALGFDYLSDNLVADKEDKFMRPFHYVIVDEADAVLLDMAQTPLIISGSPRVPSNFYQVADMFVQTLKEGEEYVYQKDDRVVYLTDQGADYAQDFFEIEDLYAESSRELYRQIILALRAHKLYKKDYDYVVMDDEVKLLDARTGRVLEGTRMQSGIHQAIETKEGVKNTKETRATASVTYQSLFNMFPKIAGMTGTGKTAEDELIDTYQLEVVAIPTNRPIQRVDYPDKIYTTLPEKLYATLSYLKAIHATGQPILVISGTVEIAEIYSNMLLQEGISHNLLTAKNAAKEVQIIKEAGQVGSVTVATPMAARGTDIKLGENVDELGGLAVIGTERLQNRRQDLQVMGRSGRQGAKGLSQFFVSLEDDLMLQHGSAWIKAYFEKHNQMSRPDYGKALDKWRFRQAVKHAQLISEDKEVSARNSTVQLGESLNVQRSLIYKLRDKLMYNDIPIRTQVDTIFQEEIERVAKRYQGKDVSDLRRYILEHYSYQSIDHLEEVEMSDAESIGRLLWQLYQREKASKEAFLGAVKQVYEFYCVAVLKAIDEAWVDEVDHLQQLKAIVNTRPIGQRNNVIEYNMESYAIYQYMSSEVKEKIVRNIMLSTLNRNKQGELSIYFV